MAQSHDPDSAETSTSLDSGDSWRLLSFSDSLSRGGKGDEDWSREVCADVHESFPDSGLALSSNSFLSLWRFLNAWTLARTFALLASALSASVPGSLGLPIGILGSGLLFLDRQFYTTWIRFMKPVLL